MKTFTKLFFSVALLLTSAIGHAANLPDGIKGLKLGMSRAQVLAQLTKIYGQDASPSFVCEPAVDEEPGATECFLKSHGFQYAGVEGSGFSFIFLGSKLDHIFVNLENAKSEEERVSQLILVTHALRQFLPMPADIFKDNLVWFFDDGSALLVVNHDTSVYLTYMSHDYRAAMKRKNERKKIQDDLQKARDSGI